ncbi:hypothetical protein Pfo_030112 [Paulownia fortunei]|nr:hypothetical protein Pfo_030112 [Paulownia fortunei]
MAGRQTRGRQRIPIRRIESQDDLYATFSKRRLGLYKKASELSTLCGVDVGIIIFSPTDNPFSFFHPSMESPIGDFARIVEAHSRARIEHLNKRLDEIQDEKEQIKEREKQLDEIDKTRQKGWWEQVPVESLNKEQVKEWKAWFQDFSSKVKNRIEELKNGGTSSTAIQLLNAPDFPDAPGPNTAGAGPSTIVQNYFPPGPSYPPNMGMIGGDQFPSQYFNVPPQAQLPSAGGGTGHIPGQYFVPPEVQYPSAAGGSAVHFPGQYNYFPPQAQDPSTSGGTGEPSTGGGTGGPSTGAGTGEAGPSHQRDTSP